MPTKLELGRLQQIALREAWQNEAGDFTPWLATVENIAMLGEAIEMSLEVEATEQQVGPFRADIVCRNLADDGSLVLIENQIARTDHSHLGQLLTYAAGLEAVTVVWIAEKFTIEHRAALDWLNTITEKKFNFFGLEVELWRIGNSPAAPKFNVVCQPNEWVKQTRASGAGEGLTPLRKLQQEYWIELTRQLTESGTKLRFAPPGPKSDLTVSLGRKNFRLWAVTSGYDPIDNTKPSPHIRVQLTIESSDSATVYKGLLPYRKAIERELGELVWMNVDDPQKRRRLFVWTSADIEDRADWPRQHQWLKSKLEAFHETFAPLVKDLEPMADGTVEGA